MDKNKKAIIFTGGILTKNILSFLKSDEIIIGVDRGAEWLMENDVIPDYFVGDFDSTNPDFLDKIKKYYPERVSISDTRKDETDTDLAVKLAVELNVAEILILGGIGTRLDHVIANIHTLLQAEEKNIPSIIWGSSNRMQLIIPGKKKTFQKSEYRYISLLPLSGEVSGINLEGFMYPLENALMKVGQPYGISNQLIEEIGTISVDEGILLVIESKD